MLWTYSLFKFWILDQFDEVQNILYLTMYLCYPGIICIDMCPWPFFYTSDWARNQSVYRVIPVHTTQKPKYFQIIWKILRLLTQSSKTMLKHHTWRFLQEFGWFRFVDFSLGINSLFLGWYSYFFFYSDKVSFFNTGHQNLHHSYYKAV